MDGELDRLARVRLLNTFAVGVAVRRVGLRRVDHDVRQRSFERLLLVRNLDLVLARDKRDVCDVVVVLDPTTSTGFSSGSVTLTSHLCPPHSMVLFFAFFAWIVNVCGTSTSPVWRPGPDIVHFVGSGVRSISSSRRRASSSPSALSFSVSLWR